MRRRGPLLTPDGRFMLFAICCFVASAAAWLHVVSHKLH